MKETIKINDKDQEVVLVTRLINSDFSSKAALRKVVRGTDFHYDYVLEEELKVYLGVDAPEKIPSEAAAESLLQTKLMKVSHTYESSSIQPICLPSAELRSTIMT